MATPGGPSEIGAVSVGVTADATGLKQGLNQAKAETEAAGQAMAASTEKTVGQQIKATTKLIHIYTKLAGAAGAIVAVYHAVGAAVEFVNTVMRDGAGAAERFNATLSAGVGADAPARLEALRTQIQGVQSELARAQEAPWWRRGGRFKSVIEDDLAALRAMERAASGQIKGQKGEEARKKGVKEIEGIEGDIDKRRRSLMTEEERAREDYRELLGRLAALTADPKLADRANAAMVQLKEYERARQREAAKLIEDAIKRGAAEMRKQIGEAARDFTRELRNSFGPDTVSPDMRALRWSTSLINRNLPRDF